MPYKSIVVGTDGSKTAELAVRHAAQLARAVGARLTIVCAFTPHPDEVARSQQTVPDDMKYLLTDAHQAEDRVKAGKAVAREEGVKDPVGRVEGGDPAEPIRRAPR